MYKKFVNKFKKSLVSLLCVSMLMPNFSVMAADTTDVNFNVKSTEVNITVPMNFAVTINPNLPYDEGGFVYSDNIKVTNDTKCPITLGISGFDDEAITFEQDVLPGDISDWDNLSVKETKKYFALGILGSDDTEWMNYSLDSALYAKTIQESNESISFGEVKPSQSVNFDLEASYGKAVKEGFTFTYQITWVSELYEGGELIERGESYKFEIIEDNSLVANNVVDSLLGVETAKAASINEEDIDGTCRIVGVTSDFDESTVVIPSYYQKDDKIYKVVEIGEDAFSGLEGKNENYTLTRNIVKVIIPDTVEKISRNAFNSCVNLTNVTISNSVDTIEAYAFANCSSMENINIKIEDANAYFEEYCFHSIGENAVLNVVNPEMYKKLNDSTFINQTTKVVNTNSSKKVIESFNVGENVIAKLYSMDNEYSLVFSGAGQMYDYESTPSYVEILNKYSDISVEIKEGITSVGNYILNEATTINKVSIPSSVNSIGAYAFANCSNLTKVSLSEGLTSIGNFAFNSCSFEYIILPSSLNSIGDRAFEYCKKLEGLVIPENCTSLGVSSINECHNLRYVDVLGDVSNYGAWVFYGSGNNTNDGLKIYVNSEELQNKWEGERGSNFLSSNASIIVRENNDFYYENAEKSVWSWDATLPIGEYQPLIDWCNTHKVSTIYQAFNKNDLVNNIDKIESFMQACSDSNIEVWYMAGDTSWCYDYIACIESLQGLISYNWNRPLDSELRINNIMFDNEIHALEDYATNEAQRNEEFITSCKNIYFWARRHNYKVGHTFGGALLEDHKDLAVIYTNYCDSVAIMNYWVSGYVAQCNEEINLCEKYGIPFVSIASFGTNEPIAEWPTIEGATNSWKEISNSYTSPLVGYSYHWYGSVKDLSN